MGSYLAAKKDHVDSEILISGLGDSFTHVGRVYTNFLIGS